VKQLTIITLSLILLFSCAKDKDEFIPNELKPIERELRNLLPSNSSQYILNSNEQSPITSQYNLQIEMDPNSFFEAKESSNYPFQFNFVELATYSDYLSQNITHLTGTRVDNVIYSIYLAASENNEQLSLINDKKIKVRFRSDIIDDDIIIGKGYIDNGEILWDYDNQSIPTSIDYITWTIKNEDGTNVNVNGYELSVSETGWYSIGSNDNSAVRLSDVCINLNSEFLNAANSVVYFLSKDNKLLTKAQGTENNSYFCNYNLPISGTEIQAISISYVDGDQNFYYSQETFSVDALSSNLSLNPEIISKEELKEKLENL